MTDSQTDNETLKEILKKIKEIENKIDLTEMKSTQELKNLESKIEATEKESFDRFKRLENRGDEDRRRSKWEYIASNEDQLFFGVIISLFVLFVTLPINDLASFLENVLKQNHDLALTNAGNIKYVGIVLFLISTITRYCAVFGDQRVSKKLRFASFEGLWLELGFLILIITFNLSNILSPQIGVLGLSVTFFVITLIFVGMILLERYILRIYAKKELIAKEYSPFASAVLLTVVFGLTVAFLVELFALVFGFGFHEGRFLLTYVVTTILTLIIIGLVRRKRTRS